MVVTAYREAQILIRGPMRHLDVSSAMQPSTDPKSAGTPIVRSSCGVSNLARLPKF